MGQDVDVSRGLWRGGVRGLRPPQRWRALACAAVWLASLSALMTLRPAQAVAQDRARIVVMDVPGGGTIQLRTALAPDERAEVMNERWLLKQAQRRGIRSKRLIRDSKKLGWVMDGAKVDLIVNLERSRDKKTYEVQLITREKAQAARTFTIDSHFGAIDKNGAEAVRAEVFGLLGWAKKSAPEVKPLDADPDKKGPDGPRSADGLPGPDTRKADGDKTASTSAKKKGTTGARKVDLLGDPIDEDPDDPETIRKRAVARQRADEDAASGRRWLWLQGGGELLKRDLSVLSPTTGAVLDYRSAFFPGYHLRAEVYPLASSPTAAGRFGIYGTFRQGFDSVVTTDEFGAQTLSINHLQFELAPSVLLPVPGEGPGSHRVRLRAGVRRSSFSVQANSTIPATALTQVIIAGLVSYPVIFKGVWVHGAVEISPVGFWGDGLDQFGQDASTWGAGASFGVSLEATKVLSVGLFYDMAMSRSKFTGVGLAQFENAGGFELMQSVQLGLVYQN